MITNFNHMKAKLHPLAASKMLKHCEIFLSTMKQMENEELVALAFNEFVSSADRTIQYLQKEMNELCGSAPSWSRNKRDNLLDIELFRQLRHIIVHHLFIPLTPIIKIENNNIPPKDLQVNEYRLDLELLPKDKDFDKKRGYFIEKYGPSLDAISLCSSFFNDLSDFVKEAERNYGNKQHYLRSKVKSMFRVNKDLSISLYEKAY